MMSKPPPGGQRSGIAGALGGITSLGQLVQLLKPHFLPSSYAQPPLASTNTGHRAVVNPVQQTVVTMVAGTYTWIFPNPWNTPPVVTITPVGAPPAAGTTVNLGAAPTVTSVSIVSTSNLDVRAVHIIAQGNPT
jgi:hypothetical protein